MLYLMRERDATCAAFETYKELNTSPESSLCRGTLLQSATVITNVICEIAR